jgi:histidinol-phosphate/aromatic aminotransferase/cobyric acid decarboxylase-like protein
MYEELAFDLDDGDKGHFLSGWQCENPFVADFLTAVRLRAETIDHRKYVYFDDDEALVDRLRALHAARDGRDPQAVLCGSGTTALLFALVTYLHARGIRTVHFIPPLYFTLHRAFGWYGIDARPVTDHHAFEPGFELMLPHEGTHVLFLTDPVWYAGKAIAREVMQAIAAWQARTGSLVVIDGSLQYLHWEIAPDTAALFDPTLTFRLVCPSKQLCVHGYRFSYLLLPRAVERDVAWTYSNIAGPTGADSLAFAREAVAALEAGDIPRKLVNMVTSRHRTLRAAKVLESVVSPDAGYFVFERITVALPSGYKLVDGRYFQQHRFPGYAKINLLSPALDLLLRHVPDGLAASTDRSVGGGRQE